MRNVDVAKDDRASVNVQGMYDHLTTARSPGGTVMTLDEVEKEQVGNLREGQWFITVTANEALNGNELATGWVDSQSDGATLVKLNRSRDNSFWIDRGCKVLPIENPFGDVDFAATRQGDRERNVTLGTGTAVAILDDEAADGGTLTLAVDDQPQVETATVAATASVDPNVAQSLRKRLEFWKGKLAQATDEANVEAATDAITRIEAEAAGKGVDLKVGAPPKVANDRPVAGAAGKGKGSKVPRSVQDANKLQERAAKVAAEAKARPAGEAKPKAPPKPKADKVLRPCLDGCGAMVGSNFQMGHDAKLKSLLLKIERGEEQVSSVPEIVAGIVKFKKGELETLKDSQGKTTGKVQHMVCTAAPVKFQGRTDMELTKRES